MTSEIQTLCRRLSGVTLASALLAGTAYGAGAPLQAVAARHRPLPPAQVPRGEGKGSVSLNVDNAPIRAVLRLLFRRSNQSYVLGPNVAGTVTASLRDIPFDTALNQIVAANSVPLTKKVVNGIYVIKGPAQPARSTQRTLRRRRVR